MLLCLLSFGVLVIVGKLGLRSVKKEKAKRTQKVFAKSLLLLIPFALMLIGIKFQARRFKDILVKNSPEGSHLGCQNKKCPGKHGRSLQSGFPPMDHSPFPPMDQGPFPMPPMDHGPFPMPPMEEDGFESHSNFVFNANING